MARKTTKQRNEELAKVGKKLRHYGLKLRLEPSAKQRPSDPSEYRKCAFYV